MIFCGFSSPFYPSGRGEDGRKEEYQIMKHVYMFVLIFCMLGTMGFTSEVMAIDAYFDSEISTSLEYTPNTGTLLVQMIACMFSKSSRN